MRASAHKQSPDWRFQLQRHACEMTSCDFNCLAVGNKVFRRGNANCLATEGGSIHISGICSTPRPGFTVFTGGGGVKTVRPQWTAQESISIRDCLPKEKTTASVELFKCPQHTAYVLRSLTLSSCGLVSCDCYLSRERECDIVLEPHHLTGGGLHGWTGKRAMDLHTEGRRSLFISFESASVSPAFP